MNKHYFNDEGKNVFGIEDNSSVQFVDNNWTPTGMDATGNPTHTPTFTNICVNPADMFVWQMEEDYLVCRAENGNDYYIGPDFTGRVYVDGRIYVVVEGEVKRELDGSYLWVACEDGYVRHEEGFDANTKKLAEVVQWADYGHCCTKKHVSFSNFNVVGHLVQG